MTAHRRPAGEQESRSANSADWDRYADEYQATHGEFGMQADGVLYLPPKPYAATVIEMRDGTTAFAAWPPNWKAGALFGHQAPTASRVKPPGDVAYVFGTVVNVLPRRIHVPSPWGVAAPPGP